MCGSSRCASQVTRPSRRDNPRRGQFRRREGKNMATTSVESMRKEVPGWGIWPLWVAACATGNAVGALAFSDWGPRAAPDAGVVFQALAYWPILVAATFPGFLQWAIFRRWFPGAGWWVVATGVGSFLGFMTYMWMGAAAD